VVYAGTNGQGILASSDGGNTWMPLNNGLGNKYITKLVVCNGMIYAGASWGGIWSRSIPENLTPPFLTHNTGNMQVSVFQNGAIGHDAPNWTYGGGMLFQDKKAGLFTGGLIVGPSGRGTVNGHLGSFGINGDFRNTSPISGFTNIEGQWDQVSLCTFDDGAALDPLDLKVVQRTYSNTGEDLVVLRYNLGTTSGSIDGVYAGMFADWDVGGEDHWDTNLGEVDISRNLVYQYLEGGDPDPNYYGLVALDGISGCRITGKGHSLYIRDSSFSWISTINEEGITEPGDGRIWIGSGPFALDQDESVQVSFALVAGSNLEELQLNAELAAQRYLELDDNTSTGSSMADGFRLEQNRPNPFGKETRITYSIPYPCDVSISVYRSDGVQVRSVHRNDVPAGLHHLLLNGDEMDPGIYFYSIRAGDFIRTRVMVHDNK
jgi:hypothetical protein